MSNRHAIGLVAALPRQSQLDSCGLRRTRLFAYALLNIQGRGGAQAFHPKEDNAAGLLIFDSHPVSNIILGLSRQPL